MVEHCLAYNVQHRQFRRDGRSCLSCTGQQPYVAPTAPAYAAQPAPYTQPGAYAQPNAVAQPSYAQPGPAAPTAPAPPYGNNTGQTPRADQRVAATPNDYVPGLILGEDSPFRGGPPDGDLTRPLDIDVLSKEAMTGRLMFGVGVNSDAGLVGSIMLEEQNFDWSKVPTSWEDIRNATAWRGGASISEWKPCRAHRSSDTRSTSKSPTCSARK